MIRVGERAGVLSLVGPDADPAAVARTKDSIADLIGEIKRLFALQDRVFVARTYGPRAAACLRAARPCIATAMKRDRPTTTDDITAQRLPAHAAGVYRRQTGRSECLLQEEDGDPDRGA